MTDENETQSQDQGTTGPDPKTEKTVPYDRFQKVNEAKKQAEETLNTIATELLEDVPEDMRDIVPNLPPAEQIKWLRSALKKGLFASKETSSSPDSQRPSGKVAADYLNLTPYEKLSMGYSTKR